MDGDWTGDRQPHLQPGQDEDDDGDDEEGEDLTCHGPASIVGASSRKQLEQMRTIRWGLRLCAALHHCQKDHREETPLLGATGADHLKDSHSVVHLRADSGQVRRD